MLVLLFSVRLQMYSLNLESRWTSHLKISKVNNFISLELKTIPIPLVCDFLKSRTLCLECTFFAAIFERAVNMMNVKAFFNCGWGKVLCC